MMERDVTARTRALMTQRSCKHRRDARRGCLQRRYAIFLAIAGGTWGAGNCRAQMPTGADVVAGQAAISQAGNVLDVNASTNRTIVNWDSFSVGAANTANFNLPTVDSAILNRVTSANMPSTIAGSVHSNGSVYLVNPSGIVVSSTGMVNTNGFTASTFDIANDAFMAGGALAFANNGSTAAIVNDGTINTGAGGAHLIANQIANHGTITSAGGNITLSGGGSVTLDNGVTYVQPTMDTLASGISPTAGLIQNTGAIRATGAATSGGEVYLVNPNGEILHDGTIAASIAGPAWRLSSTGDDGMQLDPTVGGHVQLEADNITLTESSVVDASGTAGGGTVLVGGDWQGSGDMTQATTVTMQAGAVIDASATEQGDGGTIVLWSDIHNLDSVTQAFGTLFARAGRLFGDGGQIETSGHVIEVDEAIVDAGSANGDGGQWLIDPYNWTINVTNAWMISSALSTGTSVTIDTQSPTGPSGTINNDGALDNDDTVLGDIQVNATITKMGGGNATLTLNAANSIIINAEISSSVGQLNVTLDADNNVGVGDGGGIVILSSDITTNGGDLRFGTDRTATIGGSTTKIGGDVFVNSGSTLSTDGGSVEVSGETILGATGGLTINTDGGDVTFDGVLNSGNSYSFISGIAGTGSWDAAANLARNGTSGGAATGDSYLVAISSRLENSIASSVTLDNGAYRGAWIGVYRDRNNTQGNGVTTWHYAGGPDANQPFFSQDGNSSNDSYNNFGSGEPNGTGTGGEYAGQFFGTQGLWNDLSGATPYSANMSSPYNVLGYVRETNLAASPLTINAGSGAVTFNGGIGGSKALSALNVTSGGVTLNGNSLITTGAQNFSSALTVNSAVGLAVDGTALTTGGALGFAVADNISLGASISASGNVSISGNAIVLGGNQLIDAGSNDITLTVDDVSGGVLSLDTTGHFTFAPKSIAWEPSSFGGQLDFDGAINSGDFTGSGDAGWLKINNYSALGGLTLGKEGNTSSIRVFDPIDINGPVRLYGNKITIEGGIDTSGMAASEILLKANTGIFIGANQSLVTDGGNITFDGNVNSEGTARSLTVNPGTADAIFNGTVGGSAALSALTVNGTANVNADVTTNGLQNWADTVTIGGSGTRTLNAGTLTTQAIVGGSNDFALLTDDLILNGNVASTGSITIAPKTAGTDIGVGNVSGTFSLDNTDFSRLQDGFASITIGDSSAGDLVVGGITSLTDDLTLRAGASSDLFVNDSLAWSSDNALTLAAGQDIFVNSNIDIAGSSAALNLYFGGTNGTSTPSSSNNYFLDVANRRTIRFDETSAGLKIGNESFTLLDSVSALQGMAASGRYALADSLSLAGTTYDDAFYAATFTGKLDGLGNEANGLSVRANDGGNYGLFGQLSDAAIRHFGVTNVDLLGQSISNAAAFDLRIGGVAGNVSGSGTTVLDGVWSTGVIATKQGSQQDVFYAGGLVGGHDSGGLQIIRSFSTVNVSSQGSHSGKMALGGLVGDMGDFNGISSIGGSAQTLLIDRSYANGSIVEGTYDGYYGSGGLVGVIYGDVATLTDSFSRSNVVGGISSGGIAGYSLPGTTKTFQRLYTTLDRFGNGTNPALSYKSDTLATGTNNGTQLPSGWSSDIWNVGELPTLKAVGVPASLLYVQVISGTGIFGDLAAPTYRIVDAAGNLVTLGSGDYSGLDGVTGTGRYTLGQFTNAGVYDSVSYLSGLGFTGADANLFALNPFTTAGSYTITPRSITAVLSNAGVNKVYDGNVNAGSGYTPSWSFTNIVSGDAATLSIGSSFFNDSDVSDATLITINGLSLAGITSSNGSLVSDYVLANTTASVAANITAKPIVINGLFANDKIYDGNRTVLLDSGSVNYSGLVSGDSVSLTGLGGTFADKNVGANKSVSVTGSFTGADASNYSTSLPSTLQAAITPKSITTSGIISSNRIYDRTTAAVVDATNIVFDGMVAGDTLTVSGTVGAYADKNVGAGKTVTLSGSTYGGLDAGNYTIAGQSSTTSDITPKSVLVSGLAASDRVYDGTTTATINHIGVVFDGIISGDTLTASDTAGTFIDKNVGTDKSVNLSGTTYGGADVGNYAFTDQASSTADITPKSIAVSGITVADRVYDGTTAATVDVSGVTFAGIVGGDDLSASGTTGVFANKNVAASKSVTLSGTHYGGTDVGNYSFTDQVSTTADITPKSVAVSGLVANSRVYDGTTNATVDYSGTVFTGIVGGDDLTASGTIGTFTNKNVGTGKSVALSGTSYGGTDVGNYAFTDHVASAADITPRSLVVTRITAADKVYDATTDAVVDDSGVNFAGLVSGDVLSIDTLSGLFADKNAANGKPVTLATTYTGTDLGNYAITDQANATASITPLSVSVSGVTANDKVYDTNTIATLSGAASANTLAGDSVSLETNYIANFASQNAGSGIGVSVNGYALAGTDAANYTLVQPTGLTAKITPAPLTITANNDSKFVTKSDIVGYAGATYDGFVGSEGIGDLLGSLVLGRSGGNESAGTYVDVLTASGLTSLNYSIAFLTGDYTIVPAEQFLIRFGNSDTIYGDSLGFSFLSAEYMDNLNNVATLTPTVVGNQYSFNDGVGGTASFTLGIDDATLSTSGHANVGTYGLAMNGLSTSGGNFSDNLNLFGSHTVGRANLVIGAGGVSKTYDGTNQMNNLSLNMSGLVSGDAVNTSGQGSYSERNAGVGLNYLVENLTLGGDDANNYVLPGGTTLSGINGIITAKNITITAPSVSKVYDGNTAIAATATQLQDWTTQLGVSGDSLDAITLTYDDKNVGTGKALTPSAITISDGNGGLNYNITLADDTTSVITRLGSVTWIGGATGNWSDPANWAGGAVPDLANVGNVIIPLGVTPVFDASVAGPVEIDSFAGGNLHVDDGTLDVDGAFSADTLTQTGGTLNSGTLQVTDFAQTAGTVNVDSTLTVTNSFTQSPAASIDVGGQVDITHTTGVLTINNVSRDAVKLNSTAGGVHVVNLDASGDLDITANGDVTQDNAGTLTSSGTTTIATPGDVDLDGPNNDFVGIVNVDGGDVTLKDSAGGIQLGDVTTAGSLDITAVGGDLTQTPGSQIDVGGGASLDASGEIILAGEQNQFRGSVSLDASTADVVQSIGDLVLDVVNVIDDFTARSVQGNVLQTPSGTVTVGDQSKFTARREIKLLNSGNDFAGNVQVDAPIFRVQSVTPLSLTRTGAARADEAVATQAQTVNDTFVRPAAVESASGSAEGQGGAAGSAWYGRFTTFMRSLFTTAQIESPQSIVQPADVTVDESQVFLRAQQDERRN